MEKENLKNLPLIKRGRLQYNQLMAIRFPKYMYLKVMLLSYLIVAIVLAPIIVATVQFAICYGYWFISSTPRWILASLLIAAVLMLVNGFLVFLNLMLLRYNSVKIKGIEEYDVKAMVVGQIFNPFTFGLIALLLFLLGGMMI